MDAAEPRTSSRLLRALLAGGVLAAGWFLVDMIVSAQPASAAETVDVVPVIDDLTSPVLTVLAPVTDPIVHEVIVPVVTPVLEPLEPVLAPVLDQVVAPVTQVLVPALVPAVETAAPDAPVAVTTTEIEDVAGASSSLPGVTPLAPAAPTSPVGNPPEQPVAPATTAGSPVLLLGDVASGTPTTLGSTAHAVAVDVGLPASPTFVSDTTPD